MGFASLFSWCFMDDVKEIDHGLKVGNELEWTFEIFRLAMLKIYHLQDSECTVGYRYGESIKTGFVKGDRMYLILIQSFYQSFRQSTSFFSDAGLRIITNLAGYRIGNPICWKFLLVLWIFQFCNGYSHRDHLWIGSPS